MSIPVSASTNRLADLPVYSAANEAGGKTAAAGAAAETSEASGDASNGRVQAKAQLNSAIVQSSLTLNAGNEPLALVLKSAITGINEKLAPEFGENAIQNAASQDNSPQGTADRIVSLSTAFFQAFKDKNPELSDDEAASKFLDTIKGGIEKGFSEAKDILQGLKVLNGDVASNIDKTYELVQQGLAKFGADHGVGGDKAAEQNGGVVGPQGGTSQSSTTQASSSQLNVNIKSAR